MNRIESYRQKVQKQRYPIAVAKLKLTNESMRESEGESIVVRRAKAFANVLDKIPIFIEEEDLFVGAGASIPGGFEIQPGGGIWSPDDIDSLLESGGVVSDEVREVIEEYARHDKGQDLYDNMYNALDGSEAMQGFVCSGIMLPPWNVRPYRKGHVVDAGGAGTGLGMIPKRHLAIMDFETVLARGLNDLIRECDEVRAALDLTDGESYQKSLNLKAMKICLEAFVRYAARYAALAEQMAAEEQNETRRKELLKIASNCRRVPAEPPRDFPEAMQFYWFLFVVNNDGGVTGMGRFDQILYPYYRASIDAGEMTDEDVLEYLQMLRLADMRINGISGKETKKRQVGMAKWHNMVIGGVKPDGSDATNELSYLVLEAALRTRTPHHTITIRVADSTPDALLLKGIECHRNGLSMPAFVGDNAYIEYFVKNGAKLEDARDFAIAGCIDGEIPGRTVSIACDMMVVAKIFDCFLHDGIDPRTGLRVGQPTGDLDRFDTFDEFYAFFKEQTRYYMRLSVQKAVVNIKSQQANYPDAIQTALMRDGIRDARDVQSRIYDMDNSLLLNTVGIVNVIDSLIVIRELVYRQKLLSMSQLIAVLDANWAGNEALRDACIALPKYGNNDPAADDIAQDFYTFWAESCESFRTPLGGVAHPTGISVTAHQPGGALCGATPDGRYAHEILADGCVSPTGGRDHNGPLAVFSSAMKLPQNRFNAMLLNMKFHPTALNTEEDQRKLMAAIRVYLKTCRHVQFNIVDKETLLDAQKAPEKHEDLMVRIAGYSTYFVALNEGMQNEIIKRTENVAIN